MTESSAEFTSDCVEDTLRLGAAIGATLCSGDVIALAGDLGAGKTHLAKGLAAGLGADADLVNSPTFVLLQHYQARVPVYHFDTYRLSDPGEFEDIGGTELLEDDGVCLIEWPDRVLDLLPGNTVRIELTATAPEQRVIRICGESDRAKACIRAARNLQAGN